MDFKVLIADSAIGDLRAIVEFVAEDDPIAAARLADKLINHALNLAVFPTRHPIFDRERKIHKMAVPPYLIFYTCEEQVHVVNIIHIWHGARRSPDFQ
ncbi:MAG: type II toxin-antitoxin system RelE/ParE family toxin [Verrucomicrobiota bacterium]